MKILNYLAQCSSPSGLLCCRYIADFPLQDLALSVDRRDIVCTLPQVERDRVCRIWHRISAVDQSLRIQLADSMAFRGRANISFRSCWQCIQVQNSPLPAGSIACKPVQTEPCPELWPEGLNGKWHLITWFREFSPSHLLHYSGSMYLFARLQTDESDISCFPLSLWFLSFDECYALHGYLTRNIHQSSVG